jgi:hypothetical protein
MDFRASAVGGRYLAKSLPNPDLSRRRRCLCCRNRPNLGLWRGMVRWRASRAVSIARRRTGWKLQVGGSRGARNFSIKGVSTCHDRFLSSNNLPIRSATSRFASGFPGMIHLSLKTGEIQENRSRIDKAAVTRCRIVICPTRASSARSAASALALRRCGGTELFGSDTPEPCGNPTPRASPDLRPIQRGA